MWGDQARNSSRHEQRRNCNWGKEFYNCLNSVLAFRVTKTNFAIFHDTERNFMSGREGTDNEVQKVMCLASCTSKIFSKPDQVVLLRT